MAASYLYWLSASLTQIIQLLFYIYTKKPSTPASVILFRFGGPEKGYITPHTCGLLPLFCFLLGKNPDFCFHDHQFVSYLLSLGWTL